MGIIDFLGLHFDLEKVIISPPESFLASLTQLLLSVLTSVNVHGHACQKTFIHHQSHFTLCSLHPSWTPAPQVSPVLDQAALDPTQAVLGYSITTECRISISPAFVQQTGCSQRSSVTYTGTQPVIFHRRFPHMLGSQLARSSPLRSMLSTGFQSAHQLARTRSLPSCSPQVGTSLDESDSSSLLRHQYGSSSNTQTGRHPFQVAF